MSTGNVNLDILINKIQEDAFSGFDYAVETIRKKYPTLSESDAREIHLMIATLLLRPDREKVSIVVTAPPSFAIRAKTTKVVVEEMLEKAQKSILITGYSLSDYFSGMVDRIIKKSQEGVYVKFYVNDIDSQSNFDKLCRYKGRFLKIYNYPQQEDSMSALHAKVISVDGINTLITSANLSYHGQEGNIELGTYIVSSEIARQINDIFKKLLSNRIFVEV